MNCYLDSLPILIHFPPQILIWIPIICRNCDPRTIIWFLGFIWPCMLYASRSMKGLFEIPSVSCHQLQCHGGVVSDLIRLTVNLLAKLSLHFWNTLTVEANWLQINERRGIWSKGWRKGMPPNSPYFRVIYWLMQHWCLLFHMVYGEKRFWIIVVGLVGTIGVEFLWSID